MIINPYSIFIWGFIGISAYIVLRGMWREWVRVNDQAALSARLILEDVMRAKDLHDFDFRNLQSWVGRWSDRVLKPKGVTLSGTYKHLSKEVVELGKELDEWEALGGWDSWDPYNCGHHEELLEKIAKELVDIDIVTCHLAHQLNIRLAHHFREKMIINENRQWADANSEGVSQHID